MQEICWICNKAPSDNKDNGLGLCAICRDRVDKGDCVKCGERTWNRDKTCNVCKKE
jgi:hypothetical protein